MKLKLIITVVALVLLSYIAYINIYPTITEYKVLRFYQANEFHLGVGNMPHYFVTYIDENGVRVTTEFYQGEFIKRDINELILRCRNGYCNLYVPPLYDWSNIQNVTEVYIAGGN